MTNAAREGARFAIVNQDPTLVTQRALNQVAIAEVAAPNVDVRYYEPQPNTTDVTQNAKCGDPSTGQPTSAKPVLAGCVAVVKFETTMRILFSSGVILSAKAVFPVEYSCPNATIPVATNCPKTP